MSGNVCQYEKDDEGVKIAIMWEYNNEDLMEQVLLIVVRPDVDLQIGIL
jgi:hypothetical protein